MKKNNWLSDYLNFSHRERIGVMLVGGVILMFFLLPSILPFHSSKRHINSSDTSWIQAMIRLERQNDNTDTGYLVSRIQNSQERSEFQLNKQGNTYGKLFYFDPNLTDEALWTQLGLQGRTIATIRNYLAKGGKFRRPEDLKRIYGLSRDAYERLAPWIRIVDTKYEKPENNTPYPKMKENKSGISKFFGPIEINNCDTSGLIALPGIGSKLAARIVLFREKLGGFYSIDQIGETFGLPDSVFQKIKPFLIIGNKELKKININTAGLDDLKSHPYIKWAVASPVVAYRKEHGPFKDLEELKRIQAVTDDIYKKIIPYLELK